MVTSFAFTSVAAAQTASEVELWDATWAEYQALDAIPLEERGMVSVSQDLGVVIAGDIDDVFDIYSNVYNAMGLHPFLVGLTPIRHTGHRLHFIAYEDIPMPDGSIFHAATIARQTFDRRAHSYDAETFDVPGIITRQHITFTQIAAGQVLVVEHLTFEATPEYIELAAQGGATRTTSCSSVCSSGSRRASSSRAGSRPGSRTVTAAALADVRRPHR